MSKEENLTVAGILKISRILNQYFAASDFGQKVKEYSRMEWYILNFISLQPNTTEADLHRLIPTEAKKIRRGIRKLSRARLIYRAENDKEEESILELTPKGSRVCEQAIPIDPEIAKKMLLNIKSENKEQLDASLIETLNCLCPQGEKTTVEA